MSFVRKYCSKCDSHYLAEVKSQCPKCDKNSNVVNALLADVRAIVDEAIDTIPYFAYGDNEAAVRMIEALHRIRDKVSEHFR